MPTPVLPNNPQNYIVPSTISAWFAPLLPDGTLSAYTDLGNVSDVSLSLTDEKLIHESARNGLMAPDKQVITKLNGQVNMTLDELVGANLTYLWRPAEAPSDEVYTVVDQKRIRLIDTDAETIDPFAVEEGPLDYLELQDVKVYSADGDTLYVDTTDYTLTNVSGTGSTGGKTPATIARTTGGAILDRSEVVVKYSYSRNARRYAVQTGAIIEGSLKLQLLNRIGPLCAWEFPFVNLAPDGDMTINPAEWLKQTFKAEILTDGRGNRGYFYLFDNFNRLSVT
jgi:hypothetical protein